MQITKKVSGAFKIDILYLMFVVMSGFFWQERMINQDNALFSFNITAFESFELAHSRFTDIFSQVIPILLTKAGFSLNTILLSYSVALVLIPYLLFRAVLYTYKDKGMAWMLFLAQILFVSEYFFDAISESKGAIALCLFLIATLKNKNCFNNMKTFYTIGFLILLFALFTHPVSVLLIGILLFWAFANHSIDKRDNYLFFGLLIALAVLKHFLFPTTGYENDLIHQIINPAEWSDVLHDNYVLSFVMAKFREIYLFGLIFILFFFFRFLRNEDLKKAVIYLGLNIVFFLILLITFKQGDSNMMMEKNLSTLAIVVLLPFIISESDKFNVFHSLRVRFFLPILCLFFLHRVNKTSTFYTERQNTLKEWINIGSEQGKQKYLIHQDALSNTPEISLWSLPYETALLSTLNNNNNNNTITIKNIQEVEYWRGLHKNKDAFIGADFFMPYDTKKFNSKIYNFGEEGYTLLQVD